MISTPLQKLFSLLLILGASAALANDGILNQDFKRPSSNSLVVVLPTVRPVDTTIDNELVAAALRARLAAVPFRVATLSRENFADLNGRATAIVTADSAQQQPMPSAQIALKAMSMVAQTISEEVKSKLVLRSQVVRRKARLLGRYAEWDGVRVPLADLITNDHTFHISMEGERPAWSIEVLAFGDDGQLAFITYGGLALGPDPDDRGRKMVPLTSRLTDQAAIRAALEAALAPLLSQQ